MSDRPSDAAGEAADGIRAVSDAEWEAFQREAETSVHRPSLAGPAPKEPSARARMVAARLRAQDEAAAGTRRGRWGRRPKQPEPWQPEGWRTGPAWRQMQDGPRGQWHRTRRVGTVFAVLCLLVGALWFADHRGHLDLGAMASTGEDAAPLAAETARPTGAPPTALRHDLPSIERPWNGSPARRWEEGPDAIALPEAKAVGNVPAPDVAEALRLTRKFLVASGLDREVLHGARPEAALKLLDPLNEDFFRTVREGLRHPTETNDSALLFTRFDGDEVRLVGDAVKVRGRTRVEPGEQGRALVKADYSFVYALRHADGGDEVTRVVVRRAFTAEVAPPGWQATPGTLWLTELRGERAGVTCGWEPDGMFHPSFPSERPREEPAGPTMDPYDRSRAAGASATSGACGTVSRL